jgi:hypothetical protein
MEGLCECVTSAHGLSRRPNLKLTPGQAQKAVYTTEAKQRQTAVGSAAVNLSRHKRRKNVNSVHGKQMPYRVRIGLEMSQAASPSNLQLLPTAKPTALRYLSREHGLNTSGRGELAIPPLEPRMYPTSLVERHCLVGSQLSQVRLSWTFNNSRQLRSVFREPRGIRV